MGEITHPIQPRSQQSREPANLTADGGSVKPGGGMPMVVLRGRNVAQKVAAWDRG